MKSLHLLLLLLPIIATAQNSRTLINGQVTVPEGFDSEGINIYNKTANLGTISIQEGQFRLKMTEGDTLYFSAVQFEPLEVVVDKNTIANGRMLVEIREGLNELPKIVIRPHDLTGNIGEDIKGIEVVDFKIPPLKPLPGPPTGATTTRNSVVNEIGGGANQLGLIIKGIKALFPKRKKEEKQRPLNRLDKIAVEEKIRDSFDQDFFVVNLGIPPNEIGNFLAFSIDDTFDSRLLQENRKMELIQYLYEKSEEFNL